MILTFHYPTNGGSAMDFVDVPCESVPRVGESVTLPGGRTYHVDQVRWMCRPAVNPKGFAAVVCEPVVILRAAEEIRESAVASMLRRYRKGGAA